MEPSPFGPLAVIVNPHAGGGRVRRELDALEAGLGRRGLEYRLSVTTAPGDATRLAEQALDDGYRFLVAVGGDGTIQEVVNGMFAGDRLADPGPVLGVVAANSGCDLIRSFGLPEDTDAACQHLMGEDTYPIDVMRVTCTDGRGERRVTYSHNLSEIGLGAAIAEHAARMPAALGRARRFLAFWTAFARSRAVPVKVSADRHLYEGPAWNVIVANAQFTSGGLRLSPRSFPGDGVLDALVFHGPRSQAYTMLPRVYRHGDHVPDPDIHEMRARIGVSIEAGRPLRVVADGCVLGTTPATFEVIPGRILLKL